MKNKLFVARTKSALKSRAELNDINLNDYVIFKITDKARKNETLKSISENIGNEEFKYLMVLKDFVVLTTDGGLRVDTGALSENAYAQELNTPEEEAVGDKVVVEGVVKSAYNKVKKAKGLTDQERQVMLKALKSWGEHDGEEVSDDEEFVDELGEVKSQHGEEEEHEDKKHEGKKHKDEDDDSDTKSMDSHDKEGDKKDDDDGEDENNDDEEAVTKSARERLSQMTLKATRDDVMSNLKSFGSVTEDAPVFQNKSQAQRFAQTYNNRSQGVSRAEVVSADRHIRRRYGTRARFIVEISE